MFFSAAFQQLFGSFPLVTFGCVIFGAKILYKKCAHKTLMKLTTGVNLAAFSCKSDMFRFSLLAFCIFVVERILAKKLLIKC